MSSLVDALFFFQHHSRENTTQKKTLALQSGVATATLNEIVKCEVEEEKNSRLRILVMNVRLSFSLSFLSTSSFCCFQGMQALLLLLPRSFSLLGV